MRKILRVLFDPRGRAAHGLLLAAMQSLGLVAGPRVPGSFTLPGLFALLPTIVKALKKRRRRNVLPCDGSPR